MRIEGVAPLAQETLDDITGGFYFASSGEKVFIEKEISEAIINTAIVTPVQMEAVDLLPRRDVDYAMEVEVKNIKAHEALQQAVWEDARSPLVLNFASSKHPGGGFLHDARAQEEDLCRASSLFMCLAAQIPFYDSYHLNPSPLGLDAFIYSRDVPFWGFEETQPDLPVLASVLTYAAPNLNGQARQQWEQAAEQTFHRRIRNVLLWSEHCDHDVLILGAWGCGVFRNDSQMVASLFAHHLRSERFNSSFKRVIFAVYDTEEGTPTFNTFHKNLHWAEETG